MADNKEAVPTEAEKSEAKTEKKPSVRDGSKAPLRKLSVDLISTYKHINEVSVLYTMMGTPFLASWRLCRSAGLTFFAPCFQGLLRCQEGTFKGIIHK